jgi:hypothetical protein
MLNYPQYDTYMSEPSPSLDLSCDIVFPRDLKWMDPATSWVIFLLYAVLPQPVYTRLAFTVNTKVYVRENPIPFLA